MFGYVCMNIKKYMEGNNHTLTLVIWSLGRASWLFLCCFWLVASIRTLSLKRKSGKIIL